MSSAKDMLIQTLGDSANQVDQIRVQHATAQLEEWRTHPGFFSTLQDIFLDATAADDIRFQSIIYIKNHLDRYWRRTAKAAVVDDEKVLIRQRFLQALALHVPYPWIATNAFAIGRIARHDFPRFWPDIVSQLLASVRSAFEVEQGGEEQWRIENALVGLAAVVKELSSVKLGLAVSSFQQVTPETFRILGEMYQHFTQHWVEALPALSPKAALSAKILGIMRNLLVYGFEKSGEQPDAKTFFDFAATHLRDYYQIYHNLHGPAEKEVLRHVSKLTKLFATYASERPFEFLIMLNSPSVITAFVQICQREAEQFNRSWEDSDEERLAILRKIVIPAISSIRSVLKAVSDPKVLNKEREHRAEQVALASTNLQTIFSTQNISEIAILLLNHFLILRKSDLEAWEQDPEEWILEATGDVVSTENGLRIAGESLFMELVSEYKEDMTKFIVSCVQNVQHTEMTGLDHVIFRESVYNAVTLNPLALYDLIDFDTWLTTVIPAELSLSGLKSHHPLLPTASHDISKILRRRMALLIGAWVGTKCAESSRPKVYELLLSLLTPLDGRNDIVVRISAAAALQSAVDEWQFKADDFLPYLDAFLMGTAEEKKGGIIGLMGSVRQIEARMKLVRVVEVIVERMDRRIIPYVPSIMNLLPYLWEQSQEQRIFRAAVLSVLKTMTGALGEQSVEYHSFIVQLIALGTDPTNQEEFVYLYEDALDLWEEAIKNAPTKIQEQEPITGPEYNFMGMFPRAIACLQLGSESLKKVLRILECYLILDPVGLVQRYAEALFGSFSELSIGLKADANRAVMTVLEVAIQGCPLDIYFSTFVASGLFVKTIATVLTDNENMIVSSQNMNILARIAIQNPDLLLHFLRAVEPSQDVVPEFVERWAGPKFDSIGQAKSRKLNAMGLTALLRTNDPAVLSNLGSIMNVWFNVLSEVKDSEGGDALIYWRDEADDIFGDHVDFGGSYAPSAHDGRRRVFLQNDPVHTTNLMAYMKEHLAFVQSKVGGPERFREVCLSHVDEALVDQMHTMLL